ncbi:hypothetical protein [Lysinibacillus fusiformis]
MNKGKTPSTIIGNDVRNYMANHFDEQLSIDYLALITGLNPNYFGEVFKKAYVQFAVEEHVSVLPCMLSRLPRFLNSK